MSSSTELKILQAIAKFREEDAEAAEHLQELSREAEESGDYSDFDEANYDYWEAGNEAGLSLASMIESIIIAAKQQDPR